MSRAARLLDLLQTLRRHRRPVTGEALAQETGVSLRTLYRDIEALKAQGADIGGEAGLGYVLKPGFMLPPLMFSQDELEAIVLGALWVGENGDARLADAARDGLAKIAGVLPPDLRQMLDLSTLMVGPDADWDTGGVDLADVRDAIRAERKVAISYSDRDGEGTLRTIWPFALGYFKKSRVIVAWCELRADFRHFRADRILRMKALETRYPRRRAVLLREWRKAEGVDPAIELLP